jgi:hypothetical protein
MITRRSVYPADGIDLHVEHPLGRLQATGLLTDSLPQVGVSDQMWRVADAELAGQGRCRDGVGQLR